MNDNHLIICGQRVAIGPMLAHMMLSSQDLQDRLLGLDDKSPNIPETHFPVAETGGVITFQYENFVGFPVLTVCYVDDTYTATFQHIGGDSIETLEMSFDTERNVIDWIEGGVPTTGPGQQMETLPFADRFGEYVRVNVSDLECKPVGDGTWIGEGDVWTDHFDAGLQREAETARKAA